MNAPVSMQYHEYVRRMLAALPVLTDAGGNLPRYGDDDGSSPLQLQPTGAFRLDGLYRLGNVCTQSQFRASRADAGVLASTLLWNLPAERAGCAV